LCQILIGEIFLAWYLWSNKGFNGIIVNRACTRNRRLLKVTLAVENFLKWWSNLPTLSENDDYSNMHYQLKSKSLKFFYSIFALVFFNHIHLRTWDIKRAHRAKKSVPGKILIISVNDLTLRIWARLNLLSGSSLIFWWEYQFLALIPDWILFLGWFMARIQIQIY